MVLGWLVWLNDALSRNAGGRGGGCRHRGKFCAASRELLLGWDIAPVSVRVRQQGQPEACQVPGRAHGVGSSPQSGAGGSAGNVTGERRGQSLETGRHDDEWQQQQNKT